MKQFNKRDGSHPRNQNNRDRFVKLMIKQCNIYLKMLNK